MDKLNFTDEQMDQFLMGRLTQEYKNKFDQALSSDQALRLRFKELSTLVQGIDAFHAHDLKARLKKIHQDNFDQSKLKVAAKRRSLLPWMAAAATIALLLVAVMWMNNNSGMSSDKLFASNFEPYELSMSQRSDNGNTRLIELEQLYKNGQYEEAVPIFESLISQNEQDIHLKLGAGIAELALDRPKAALAYFEAIIQSGDFLFEDHAVWYSALAYLKMEKQEEAQRFLQKLSTDTEADHHQEAIELLEQL